MRSITLASLLRRSCATVIATVAILVNPGTAAALPPAPLAPACASWTYSGPMRITHSDGAIVVIDDWEGAHPRGPAHLLKANGDPVYLDQNDQTARPDGGGLSFVSDPVTGEVHGSIFDGNEINIKIDWSAPPNSTNGYTGTIDATGKASGVTQNSVNGIKTSWTIDRNLQCADAPAPAAAAPDQQRCGSAAAICSQQPVMCSNTGQIVPAGTPCPEKPPPAQQASHTVTEDADLYDVPGGNGNKMGTLQGGDAVTLSGPCPIQSQDATNGWCLVTDTTEHLTGAVWGGFISK